MSVPALENVTDAADREGRYAELSQKLPETFTGQIRRRQSSPWYNVAIFATALMVILLPMVYVGLTVMVAWALIYFAIHVWQTLGDLGQNCQIKD